MRSYGGDGWHAFTPGPPVLRGGGFRSLAVGWDWLARNSGDVAEIVTMLLFG
jgi:hypothetical protein